MDFLLAGRFVLLVMLVSLAAGYAWLERRTRG